MRILRVPERFLSDLLLLWSCLTASLLTAAMLSYSADQLCALNRDGVPPSRAVRKAIFSHHLWWPKWRHASRAVYGSGVRCHPRGGGPSTAHAGMRLGLLNARSVTNKSTAINDTVVAQCLDVLAVTETWHQASQDLPLKRCAPPGYAILDAPRQTPAASRGGGVALLFSNRFTVKRFSIALQPTTFEVLGCSLRSATTLVVYVVIYRPTSHAPSERFYEEITQLLEIVAAYRCQIVVCGDLNIHVNDPTDRYAARFADILASFDLVQAVCGPTHCAGNTLDVVITRRDSQPVDCFVHPPNIISDHGLVVCRFASTSFAVERQTRLLRPWKKLDRAAFVTSLRSSVLCDDVSELKRKSADELFDIYDDTLRRTVDEHLPAYTATVRDRRLSPWFDDECRMARRRSRMLERRYRRSLRADDRLAWVRQVRSMHSLYTTKENEYWTSRIMSNSGDSRRLWRSLSSLLVRDRGTVHQPSSHLTADKLAQFFVDKVADVRAATEDSPPPSFSQYSGSQFCRFREVSMDDVRRVLLRSPPKTCVLDPLPTSILRDVVDTLLPFIWVMCNNSLQEGCLPTSQKAAIITPVLKKPGADPDDPKNYRPISNLTFMSKIIERLVVEQMTQHLDENNLMPQCQSAYRKHHSTESALMKVLSDILDAADCRQVTLLGLLDLSAAFDTVDHNILLQRLGTSFGLGGPVLEWLKSFLSSRQQAVMFRGQTSAYVSLVCGVPQGSVLGPLLFLLYTADVGTIARRHGVTVHSYADDTQLYTSCSAMDSPTSATQLLRCICDINEWMSSNRLKLNADKTQFIWLGSPQQLASVRMEELSIGGAAVAPVDTARDLGVTLDAQLTLDKHVDSVVRSCFYQLRQLRSIRRSLTGDALLTLVHAFITSRVDYCNAVLYGVAGYVLRRLQSVLNAAARLITGVRRYEHITPTLRDTLHWLPVPQRITFKIALTVFDCVRGRCPAYFSDICVPVHSVAGRSRLRSADHGDLIVPRVQTQRYGSRSFRVSGPTVWNSLPQNLRSSDISREQFKRGLKTWLFERAYV